MREYGPVAYAAVIGWPYRLILRGITVGRQRRAARQLDRLRLTAVADGMDQGREYVDPEHPGGADTSKAHYTVKPYLRAERALEQAAEPWRWTEEAVRRRREREEAADFDLLERNLGGMRA